MNRAVFFDLDGTLIDSVPDVHLCLSAALNRVGRDPLSVAEVKSMVGGGARIMVEKALSQTGGIASGDQVDEVVSSFISEYRAHPTRLTKVYPGGYEVLDKLVEQEIGLAVCTNKPRATADPVMQELDLQKYFPLVCYGDEITHQKPDGRHIEYMLKQMNLTPDQVVMIGDSHNDVRAAHEAGVRSITVSFGYDKDVLSHPDLDLTVDRLVEVPGVLEKVWAS